MAENLKELSAHFAFGENWAAYSKVIDERRVAEAERGLLRLVPREDIAGRSFLDIGSGSGLHALAALRIGASAVVGLDIDPNSVATSRATVARHAPGREAQFLQRSVFDVAPDDPGTFEIVYSWGVLHHTGAMWEAVEKAAALVAPQGLFVLALYRKTLLCPVWRAEKKWYCKASPGAQAAARRVYKALFALGLLATGRTYRRYTSEYLAARGMDFEHDIHDWMGGYPYESASPAEVDERLRALGFTKERAFTRRQPIGFFGSGCDEFVYRRVSAAA